MSQSEFRVYVIELRPEASAERSDNGVVYVGETALDPDERFRKHLAGHRASRRVHQFGVRLRPDLAPKSAFFSRDAALKAEKRTAQRLRNRGFIVVGGQGEGFMDGHEGPAQSDG